MGFAPNSIVTVWKISKKTASNGKEKIFLQVSSSRKNQNGDYETDFSGTVGLVGKAAEKVNLLTEKSRIKLGGVNVTNHYNKETKEASPYFFTVFDFEVMENNANATDEVENVAGDVTNDVGDADDFGELPFH